MTTCDNNDSLECEAMRKIFVGGLNRRTTAEDFNTHFGQYGTMVDKVLMTDSNNVSRGFGFVTYDSADCVEAVFKARPHNLDDKQLDVKRAMPKDMSNTNTSFEKVTRLFVGGISEDITAEELQSYIESRHPRDIGHIESVDFMKDRDTGKNRGFGFIECSSPDFADRLVICESSFKHNGKQMAIKKAEQKGGADGPSSRGRGRGRGGDRGSSRGGRGGRYSSGPVGGYSIQAAYGLDGFAAAAMRGYGQSTYGQAGGYRF